MKKVIGSILCLVAIALILSHTVGQKPDIRKARRDRREAVSDEALLDLDELTLQLILKRR
jgi:hypothetical protein